MEHQYFIYRFIPVLSLPHLLRDWIYKKKIFFLSNFWNIAFFLVYNISCRLYKTNQIFFQTSRLIFLRFGFIGLKQIIIKIILVSIYLGYSRTLNYLWNFLIVLSSSMSSNTEYFKTLSTTCTKPDLILSFVLATVLRSQLKYGY